MADGQLLTQGHKVDCISPNSSQLKHSDLGGSFCLDSSEQAGALCRHQLGTPARRSDWMLVSFMSSHKPSCDRHTCLTLLSSDLP